MPWGNVACVEVCRTRPWTTFPSDHDHAERPAFVDASDLGTARPQHSLASSKATETGGRVLIPNIVMFPLTSCKRRPMTYAVARPTIASRRWPVPAMAESQTQLGSDIRSTHLVSDRPRRDRGFACRTYIKVANSRWPGPSQGMPQSAKSTVRTGPQLLHATAASRYFGMAGGPQAASQARQDTHRKHPMYPSDAILCIVWL
jgi:hypothetical protein